ncbi:hypothetical protein Tco_1573260, partial [Tanacetum coccineum]
MKNTEQDQNIGVSFPILYGCKIIMEKVIGGYEETIDLTNREDDVGEPGASKISERESVGKAPKAADAGVVKKGKRKGKKYFIVADKQGGDDRCLKKGSGKRRLVLSKDKGKKKALGDDNLDNSNIPDAGVVKKSGRKEKL